MNQLRKRNRAGFTMIELMMVVAIVAILAAIAIPLYGRYVRNGRVTEATSRMGEIVTSAKAYAQEHTDASDIPQWPPAAGAGIVDLSPTEFFTYAITSGGGTAATGAMTLTATGSGKMNGVTVVMTVPSISQNAAAPTVTGL